MHELIRAAQDLSDAELLETTRGHARRERRATAELVAHLGELDARGLALREGHASSFDYCRRALGFSESEAFARVEAARAGRRFPLVLDLLQAGELTMTTVMLLGRHLTVENHHRLLRDARGCTKDQLKEMVAALTPRPDAPVLLRRLPPPPLPAPVSASGRVGLASPPAPAPPALLEPIAPARFRYQLTIGPKTRDLLRTARELAPANAEDESLIERALEMLVADLSRRKFAATLRPGRPAERNPDSRHVPSEVRRSVWERDGGRLCLRRSQRGTVRGAAPPGVPSRQAISGRGRCDRGEHPAPLPCAQRIRGAHLLRAQPQRGPRRAASALRR